VCSTIEKPENSGFGFPAVLIGGTLADNKAAAQSAAKPVSGHRL